MAEVIDDARSELNWRFQLGLLSAVHRQQDGMYVVSRSAPFGKSYLLNEEQFPIFERWFIEINPMKKQSRIEVIIRGLLMIVVFGITVATFLGYIGMDLFAAMVVLFIGLLILFGLKGHRASQRRLKERFPFPDAPLVKVGLLERGLKPFRVAGALPGMKWVLAGGLVVFGLKLLLIAFAVVALLFVSVLSLFTKGGVDEAQALPMVPIFVAVWVFYFLIFMAFMRGFLFRRRFKKRYGKSLTLENFYLSETGRLNGEG